MAVTLLASILPWSGLVFVFSRQTAVCLPFNPSLAFQSKEKAHTLEAFPSKLHNIHPLYQQRNFFVISFKRIYLPFF